MARKDKKRKKVNVNDPVVSESEPKLNQVQQVAPNGRAQGAASNAPAGAQNTVQNAQGTAQNIHRPGMPPGAQPQGARPRVNIPAFQQQQMRPNMGFPLKMNDERIKTYLQGVKPRRIFRGVNDEDMWTIVANVQKFYQKEYETQLAKFQAILEEKDREIYNLRNNRG